MGITFHPTVKREEASLPVREYLPLTSSKKSGREETPRKKDSTKKCDRKHNLLITGHTMRGVRRTKWRKS
jgi:hypothetical protein